MKTQMPLKRKLKCWRGKQENWSRSSSEELTSRCEQAEEWRRKHSNWGEPHWGTQGTSNEEEWTVLKTRGLIKTMEFEEKRANIWRNNVQIFLKHENYYLYTYKTSSRMNQRYHTRHTVKGMSEWGGAEEKEGDWEGRIHPKGWREGLFTWGWSALLQVPQIEGWRRTRGSQGMNTELSSVAKKVKGTQYPCSTGKTMRQKELLKIYTVWD